MVEEKLVNITKNAWNSYNKLDKGLDYLKLKAKQMLFFKIEK